MFIVGLTGGIGCGKTTAGKLFEKLGILVIDADDIAKTLVLPGSPLLEKITHHFGPGVLNPDDSLNRSILRDIVFNQPDQKKKLEAIMHPPILQEMQRQAASATSPYCIFSIPLLFETAQNQLVDRILVIDVPFEIQKERVIQRSGISAQHVQAIISSQVSRDYRLKHADDIIDNRHDLDKLETTIQSLHKKYMELAQLPS